MVWSRGSAIQEGQILAGGDPQLQCFVLGAAESNAAIQVRWYFNGGVAEAMSFRSGDVAKAYRNLPRPGEYRVELFVNGEERGSVGFSIQSQASPLN